MLEFIKGSDGNFYFIEANPRPWLLVDFQRLRGRNFFHYLNPNTPRNFSQTIDNSYHYIELTGLCRAFEILYPDSVHSEILKLLASLEGPKRLSTFDENDPGPMAYELQILSEKYGADFVIDIKNAVNY
jgi:predicted ATP-grasp superfamily ATP-dependent carboligase